jgi:hypothetical protein
MQNAIQEFMFRQNLHCRGEQLGEWMRKLFARRNKA